MWSGIFKVAVIVSEEAVLTHTVRILMILMAIAILMEEIMDLQEVQRRTVEDHRILMAIELTVAVAEAEEMLTVGVGEAEEMLTVGAGEAVVLTAAAVVVTVVMTKIIQVITM